MVLTAEPTRSSARSCGKQFEVVGYGVDDVTFGFDMTGSRSLARLNETPGLQTRRGKMLGDRASWGQFVHLLGRSASFWKPDTLRLYVQAKLTPDGSLCSPSALSEAYQALLERMAWVGLVSYEPAWITRVDVAVDGRCRPADGKLLLDALEAVRLPNGWRTRSVGVPRSTVYFSARVSDNVKARAYCRNLKLKRGAPFGLIRLEAEERFAPRACPDEALAEPAFAARIWTSRYGNLTGTVTRLAREVQTLEIAERVERGELDYKQGERLAMFIELERLGIAKAFYPKTVHAARSREARKLGYSISDTGASPLNVNLSELLRPYVDAVGGESRGDADARAAAPSRQGGGAPAGDVTS